MLQKLGGPILRLIPTNPLRGGIKPSWPTQATCLSVYKAYLHKSEFNQRSCEFLYFALVVVFHVWVSIQFNFSTKTHHQRVYSKAASKIISTENRPTRRTCVAVVEL